MSVTKPTLTRHADGSITAEWPDPPRPTYEVAHEVLVEYVEQLNELNRLRAFVVTLELMMNETVPGGKFATIIRSDTNADELTQREATN